MKKWHLIILTIILSFLCASSCKAELVFEETSDQGGRIYRQHLGKETRMICQSVCSDGISKLYMLTGGFGEEWSIDSFDVETHQFSHISSVEMPPYDEYKTYGESVREAGVNAVNMLFFYNSQLWGFDSSTGFFKLYDEASDEWLNRVYVDVDKYVDPCWTETDTAYEWTYYRIYDSFLNPVILDTSIYYIAIMPVASVKWQFSVLRTDLESGDTELISTDDMGNVLTIFPISSNQLGIIAHGGKLLAYSTETSEVTYLSQISNEELGPINYIEVFSCDDQLIAVDVEYGRLFSLTINDEGEFVIEAILDDVGIHSHSHNWLINSSYFSYLYETGIGFPDEWVAYIDIVKFDFD